MLFAWHMTPVAPWQDERWLARCAKPAAKCVCAHDHERVRVAWRVCRDLPRGTRTQPSLVPVVKTDPQCSSRCRFSTKRDSTALVAVTYDRGSKVRLIAHRVFTPTPGDPINFGGHHRGHIARVA
jgi:hypothetical protein